MLALCGKTVLVVGAGPVGLRRMRSAVAAGASVRLIAPQGDPGAEPDPAVAVLVEPYDPSHLEGVFVAFVCTDDAELNARIAADARERNVLVNVADQPGDCDFYMPATLRDGCVTLAVGTGGRAPGVSGMVRDILAEALPERLAEFAEALGELRDQLRETCPNPTKRMAALRPLCSRAGYELFSSRGAAGLREAVLRATEDA
jgi:siroheme synthase-like protein